MTAPYASALADALDVVMASLSRYGSRTSSLVLEGITRSLHELQDLLSDEALSAVAEQVEEPVEDWLISRDAFERVLEEGALFVGDVGRACALGSEKSYEQAAREWVQAAEEAGRELLRVTEVVADGVARAANYAATNVSDGEPALVERFGAICALAVTLTVRSPNAITPRRVGSDDPRRVSRVSRIER